MKRKCLVSAPVKEIREVLVDQFCFEEFKIGWMEQLESEGEVSSIEVDGNTQTVRVYQFVVV